MPLKVPDNLPAKDILARENIFVMDNSRAYTQDIRPLQIVILNLMPNKQETEVQLLRMLSYTPLQLDVLFLHMKTHVSKNTSADYLAEFYVVFDEIKERRFDGMIITGAPVEMLEFEEVGYWQELADILDWTSTNVTSTFHICWGAQAGIYRHYGVRKRALGSKMSGVYKHRHKNCKLLFGFDEEFYAPHSRHTDVNREDVQKVAGLEILAETKHEKSIYIAASTDGSKVFVFGHGEYGQDTLKDEYVRDSKKSAAAALPANYFPADDPSKPPIVTWRAHATLLYANWLNYYVYQQTPYVL